MNSAAEPLADPLAFLAKHERKDLLRLLTCGSVDDGKSTLIGRLLHDSGNVFIDQQAALERDSRKVGNAGADRVDYALLLDGLKAEREQGITIDVAYRYFTTERRKFIIADTPGHEQYTRNMATGASNCDLAVILIDARQGVLAQTKRHTYIATLLGIRELVIAVNKMDLVGYDEAVFDRIVTQFRDQVAAKVPPANVTFIPVSALEGDQVVHRGDGMPWYDGPTMLEHLETVTAKPTVNREQLFYPVQYVLRPDLDFRGFAGTIASGLIRKGQEILALPSGRSSRVASIVNRDGELEEAFPPQSVVVTLKDEIDVSRGDVLVAPQDQPYVGTSFEAMVVWMHRNPLEVGRSYWIKCGCNTVPGTVREIHYQVDVDTLDRVDTERLELNAIAKVVVELSRPVVYDLYVNCREAGSFILVDRLDHATVGAGMIAKHVPAMSAQVRRLLGGERGDDTVTGTQRALRFKQRPATIWLHGRDAELAARLVERQLFADGFLPYVLDCSDVGVAVERLLAFDNDIADENLRRVESLSRLCRDIGVVALGILPDQGDDPFTGIQVYVDADPASGLRFDEEPVLTLEGADADPPEAAAKIAAFLHRERIVGYYGEPDTFAI